MEQQVRVSLTLPPSKINTFFFNLKNADCWVPPQTCSIFGLGAWRYVFLKAFLRTSPPCRGKNTEAPRLGLAQRLTEWQRQGSNTRSSDSRSSVSPLAVTRWSAILLFSFLSPHLSHSPFFPQKFSLNLRHLRKSCPRAALIIPAGSEYTPCTLVANGVLMCEVVDRVLSTLVAIFTMNNKYTKNRDCYKKWPCTYCSELAMRTFCHSCFFKESKRYWYNCSPAFPVVPTTPPPCLERGLLSSRPSFPAVHCSAQARVFKAVLC